MRLLRQPDDGVALRMPASDLHQLDLQLADPERHPLFEHQRRPGQPGHRFDRLEQARKTLDLAFHVGFAALDDQIVGVAAGDDVLRPVTRRAEHAHRVIVRQHDIADRLVADRADVADDVLRHHRRGLRVDDHDRIVTDDDAGVRIALGGVRIGVIGQLVEADLLGFQVGLGSEFLVVHCEVLCIKRVPTAAAMGHCRRDCRGPHDPVLRRVEPLHSRLQPRQSQQRIDRRRGDLDPLADFAHGAQ